MVVLRPARGGEKTNFEVFLYMKIENSCEVRSYVSLGYLVYIFDLSPRSYIRVFI